MESAKPIRGGYLSQWRGLLLSFFQFSISTVNWQVERSFSKPSSPTTMQWKWSSFSTLKREKLYRKDYTSEQYFEQALAAYIDFTTANALTRLWAFYLDKKRKNGLFTRNVSKSEAIDSDLCFYMIFSLIFYFMVFLVSVSQMCSYHLVFLSFWGVSKDPNQSTSFKTLSELVGIVHYKPILCFSRKFAQDIFVF